MGLGTPWTEWLADRYDWKHYLPVISMAGGNNPQFQDVALLNGHLLIRTQKTCTDRLRSRMSCVEMSSVKYNEMTSLRPKLLIYILFFLREPLLQTTQIVNCEGSFTMIESKCDFFFWSLSLHNVNIKLDFLSGNDFAFVPIQTNTKLFFWLFVALSTACFNLRLIC